MLFSKNHYRKRRPLTMKNFTQKLCLTLTLALLLFTSTCFAKITKDDFCIGGVYIAQPMSEVIAKYGEPEVKKNDEGDPRYYVFSSPKGKSTFFRLLQS